MSTFTKSPWIAEEMSFVPGGPTHFDILNTEDPACVVAQYVSKDDAHLMAAAPDMYEALEDLLNRYNAICDIAGLDKDNPASNKARKALKKANGE